MVVQGLTLPLSVSSNMCLVSQRKSNFICLPGKCSKSKTVISWSSLVMVSYVGYVKSFLWCLWVVCGLGSIVMIIIFRWMRYAAYLQWYLITFPPFCKTIKCFTQWWMDSLSMWCFFIAVVIFVTSLLILKIIWHHKNVLPIICINARDCFNIKI